MRNIEILVILETLEDLRLLDENNKMQTTKRLLDENNKMQKTNYVSTRSADALQAYPRLKRGFYKAGSSKLPPVESTCKCDWRSRSNWKLTKIETLPFAVKLERPGYAQALRLTIFDLPKCKSVKTVL